MFCVDFRNRPPFKSFMAQGTWNLFDAGLLTKTAKFFSSEIAPSALEKSMDLYFQEMAAAGIDKAVVPVRCSAGGKNEDLLELIQKYENKFIGIISAEPFSPALSEAIDRYIVNGPCTGITLEPSLDSFFWRVDDSRMNTVYEKCADKGIPVLYTIGGLDGVAPEQISAAEKVAQNFPELKIILCHGFWPETIKACQLAAFYENIYLCTDVYLMQVPGFEHYAAAANFMIPDKIIFGSAYPLASMESAAAFYRNGILKNEVLERVMGENALKALGIDK